MMHEELRLFAFGDNRNGQCGVGGEEMISVPTVVPQYMNFDDVVSICCNNKQTFLLLHNGGLLTCGDNDNNELCRTGKRSALVRVDLLETFHLIDTSIGDGFFHVITKAGQLFSWGKNDLGQLGIGNREAREKPKPNHKIKEPVIQICCGQHHTVVLTKYGKVFTFGGNRKGQLGDGQLTSSTNSFEPPQLRHRPVVAIACGESHNAILTMGGNVWTWGSNDHGELGHGDTTARLRPELVRTVLRNTRNTAIACGRYHTMVIALNGLLFAFGSNSHGQCGFDPASMRQVTSPTAIEFLREKRTISVHCGAMHSMAICIPIDGEVSSSVRKVYVMGSNGCGQLGVPSSAVSGPNTVHPILLQSSTITLSDHNNILDIFLSPLSMSSFITMSSSSLHPRRNSQNKRKLPSLDLAAVREIVDKVTSSSGGGATAEVRDAREAIAAAFASISVLNASFTSPRSLTATVNTVDLSSVRQAYALILSLQSTHPQVVVTLGRSLLHLTEQLRQVAVDDIEGLAVYWIVLENPLLLRITEHAMAAQYVINAVLGLSSVYRTMLFTSQLNVASSYQQGAEFVLHLVTFLQAYITHAITIKASGLDPTPAVLILDQLHDINYQPQFTSSSSSVIPYTSFHNHQLAKNVDLLSEWQKFRSEKNDSKQRVFNYWQYPFLIDEGTKYNVLQVEFTWQRAAAVSRCLHVIHQQAQQRQSQQQSPPQLPYGVHMTIEDHTTVRLYFNLSIRRSHLLQDILTVLENTLRSDPNTLRLPMKVNFIGEAGQDAGGLSKELLSLALRELLQKTPHIYQKSSAGTVYWFVRSDHRTDSENEEEEQRRKLPRVTGTPPPARRLHAVDDEIATEEADDFQQQQLEQEQEQQQHEGSLLSWEQLLGILQGLAVYHGIHIEPPLPRSIYKVIQERSLTLADLWVIDEQLARGLQTLLQFPEGSGQIEEVFGTTFTVSENPLLASSRHVDLIPNGENVLVTRSNRQQFVSLFVQYALHTACSTAINQYITGLKIILGNEQDPLSLWRICRGSSEEVEQLICGSDMIGDLTELRKNVLYKGEYHDTHPVITWFWMVMSEFTLRQKQQFLSFVTGSERVALGGFTALILIIQSTEQEETSLPSSHTCFNMLFMTRHYPSLEVVRQRLTLAIEHSTGFGLV